MAGAETQLWLIEGLPGAGKTSAARRLDALCRVRGVRSLWWLEEAPDHSVLPAALRRQAGDPAFPRLCIKAFRAFLQSHSGVLILEGAAFQSTLRFMFAHARSEAEMADYASAWSEAVAEARPRLLMFEAKSPEAHYCDFVAARRGADWMEKLIGYVEATPIASQRGWRGLDGFLSFWGEYQRLCLACADALPWPVKRLPAWSEALGFDEEAAFGFFCR